MREHKINEQDNFICGWYLDDITICDKIIDFHKHYPYRKQGEVYAGIDNSHKDSMDAPLIGPLADEYYKFLQQVLDEYIKKYPFCNYYNKWSVVEIPNIQHYESSKAFYTYHTERGGSNNDRHLVFMTYLNNVSVGGETEFYHQKIKIKPEKGLTLIWGSDWTFTHRGIPAEEEKYIVTGWLNYTK
jgi:hypothetical protein